MSLLSIFISSESLLFFFSSSSLPLESLEDDANADALHLYTQRYKTQQIYLLIKLMHWNSFKQRASSPPCSAEHIDCVCYRSTQSLNSLDRLSPHRDHLLNDKSGQRDSLSLSPSPPREDAVERVKEDTGNETTWLSLTFRFNCVSSREEKKG